VWTTTDAGFEGEASSLYGNELSKVLQRRPDCAFVADGSPVTVFAGRTVQWDCRTMNRNPFSLARAGYSTTGDVGSVFVGFICGRKSSDGGVLPLKTCNRPPATAACKSRKRICWTTYESWLGVENSNRAPTKPLHQ